MTKDEFAKQRWQSGMRAEYMGKEYEIASCNFPEYLVGLDDGSEELIWVRCENMELIG